MRLMPIPQRKRVDEMFSSGMQRAVVKINDLGPFEFQNGQFCNGDNDRINMRTVVALWSRYLITIVAESRHRTRQTIQLTDIGKHVVRSLQREKIESLAPKGRTKPGTITEAVSLLTAELVSS